MQDIFFGNFYGGKWRGHNTSWYDYINTVGLLWDYTLFVATKAFIVRNGSVLIIRESSQYADGTQVSKYDLPGGRIEPGKPLLQELQREITEETGLSVTVHTAVYVKRIMASGAGRKMADCENFFTRPLLNRATYSSAQNTTTTYGLILKNIKSIQ